MLSGQFEQFFHRTDGLGTKRGDTAVDGPFQRLDAGVQSCEQRIGADTHVIELDFRGTLPIDGGKPANGDARGMGVDQE